MRQILAHRRLQMAIGLAAGVLLVVLLAYRWHTLRPARGAGPAPPRYDAGETISRLLAARGRLALSPGQVQALQRLAQRRREVLRPLQAQQTQAEQRLDEMLREKQPPERPEAARQVQIVAGLEQSRQEIERRYQARAIGLLTPRQRAQAEAWGLLGPPAR